MKLKIDVTKCQGHARCAAVAPHLHKLNSDGYNDTPVIDVPAGEEQIAIRSANACPEAVITVEE